MKIGILGTGVVGGRIGDRLIELGYEVMMGSRTAGNESAGGWAKKGGAKATHGTFEDAAKFGEMIFLCTRGDADLEVIKLAKPQNFKGKVVVDISNPLDFSKGMPPSLFISNTNSLGEEVQKAIPGARVVKTLNLVSNEVMVNPAKFVKEATMFLCGNDDNAKDEVRKILVQFGWTDIMDLGDITGARGTEMLLPVWLRIWGTLQDGNFAFKIVRGKK
jgi:8-hydroxy-5-deazaflavin:NADPH oxidoreductase